MGHGGRFPAAPVHNEGSGGAGNGEGTERIKYSGLRANPEPKSHVRTPRSDRGDGMN